MHPHGLYGSSEMQALFSVSESKNHLLAGGVPVSIQARLAVRDPETGSTLPSGASGELWIDAPSRFVAYLEDPAATERAIDADGMFRTGDLARLADTGFVYEARIGDAMRLGGFLVSPEETWRGECTGGGGLKGRGRPGPRGLRSAGRRDGAGRDGLAGALPGTVGAVQGAGADRGGGSVPDRRQPERP